MKHSKKLVAIVLTLVMAMAFGLTGCGGSDSADTGSKSSKVTADKDYPKGGTINVVIGWSAGGTTDLIARNVASGMSKDLGCNNNCTNVNGASGSIAAAQVAGTNDGQTVWGGMLAAINTYRSMDYNNMTWKDWYVFVSCQTDYVLVVNKDSKYNTIDDFVNAAKENPGALKAGNPGLGSAGHLGAVTLCNAYGIKTNHVPYEGGRAAAVGLMGKEIDYLFVAYGDVKDLIESGDVKALAKTGDELEQKLSDGSTVKIPSIDKDHPEVKETVDSIAMWGVAIPRSTPAEEVLAFENSWKKYVKSDEYKKYCDSLGVKAVAISGTDSDKKMAEGEATYAKLLDDLKLSAKSASELDIPSPDDYDWKNVDTKDVPAWPEG